MKEAQRKRWSGTTAIFW